MSEPATAAIVAEQLSKHFTVGGETVMAVDGVSLRLPRGRMVALRGSSGCGKSTLLNLLGALDRPTEGEATVAGVRVDRLTGRAEVEFRRHTVGFVFQSFNLIPTLTALENVTLPMEFTSRPLAEHAARAAELLRLVGIKDDRHQHRPAKLSGGQQQRVAIARAIANDPAVILADEPTANLDSKTGRSIVALLQELTRDGRTVIVATHSEAVAQRADVVLEMQDGRIG